MPNRITHDSIASCQYFRSLLVPRERKRILAELVAAFKAHCPTAGAIAFTGVSGSLIAPPLADKLRLPLIAVRKSLDDTHSRIQNSPRLCEGYAACGSYVIVDDFVETGSTVRRIRRTIRTWWDSQLVRLRGDKQPVFLGVLQALHDEYAMEGGIWLPAGGYVGTFGPVDCPASE